MMIAIVILISVFISADWYYYYKTRQSLDGEFGKRLEVLAELASATLAAADTVPPVREPWTASWLSDAALAAKLDGLRTSHAISNILVIREDGLTLMSLRDDLYPAGEEYPHWDMDFPAIMSALQGTPASTRLFEASRGVYLKAGYAPLPPGSPKARSVVAVEANPAFLEGLGRLRFILALVTGASILGIVLFTAFAFKATGALIRARESLMRAETLTTMGSMAAGIAHEIRNPLFIIRGAAEKLRAAHPESGADIDGYLIEEVDRLNGILTDYLLFAKDEPGRRAPLDLVTTLGRSVRNVRQSTDGSKVEIVTDFKATEAPLLGEEKKLQQAFLNVLINAREAIADRGTIRVGLASTGEGYVVQIEDDGRGIAGKDIARSFEPFYTTRTNGSGLGLPITKKIVEDHGGTIALESRAGAGTTVTIVLPAARGASDGEAPGADTRGDDANDGALK